MKTNGEGVLKNQTNREGASVHLHKSSIRRASPYIFLERARGRGWTHLSGNHLHPKKNVHIFYCFFFEQSPQMQKKLLQQ